MSLPGPPVVFVDAARGYKVVCQVCGARGSGSTTREMASGIHRWSPWQLTCLHGHHRCPTGCGRWLPACKDGAVRWHTRCPNLGPTWSTRTPARTATAQRDAVPRSET